MFKRKIYDTTIRLVDANNIIKLRKKTKIIIVDDDELDIVENLVQRGYDIYYKRDMNYSLEAEPFDIIIMDIQGIAKNLGSNMEGFALASDIKKRYPNKEVYCFSSTVKTEIASNLHKIDGFIPKDYDIDKWGEQLDNIIRDYVDVNKQWKRLEEQLYSHSIDEKTVQTIKKVYLESFKNKKFDKIDSVLMGMIEDTNLTLSILQSIFAIIKILCE